MSTDMNHPELARNLVTTLIHDATSDADASAAALPPVDVDAILRQAAESRRGFGRWIPQATAATAVLAVAVGTLLMVRPHPLPQGPIPLHITLLVDSLYPVSDYVHDELADLLWPLEPESTSKYLDDVWDAVIRDSGISDIGEE